MATARDVIRVAVGEIGVTEYPPGSNTVKYNTEYWGYEASGDWCQWCCAWVWWVFKHAGAEELFYGGGKTAGCTTLMRWYDAKGEFDTSGDIRPGDMVFFNFDNVPDAEHIGIVESLDGLNVVCIEGNTSVTSDDNGGAVMRRWRSRDVILGVVHPDYEDEFVMDEKTIAEIRKIVKEELEAQKKTSDVVPKWAIASGEWVTAINMGITDGTRPNDPVTRVEAAAMVVRAKEIADE